MELDTKIQVGQVVRSKAGRDKDRVFLVYELVDDDYVLVVDGDLRKIDKPKKKKIKHLSFYNTVLPEINYRKDNNFGVKNAYIRKLLEPYR